MSAVYKLSPNCLFCCQEVTAESVEGGLIGAVSEAEVVTAAASEGAEEATGEETVEDTALERWTQGQTHSNKRPSLAVMHLACKFRMRL